MAIFQGKYLEWLEDTPRGVVSDWTKPSATLEKLYQHHVPVLLDNFAQLTAPTLALSVSDDPFGTIPAIERLLRYYINSPTTHLRLNPTQVGEKTIGHFAFFIPVSHLCYETFPYNG